MKVRIVEHLFQVHIYDIDTDDTAEAFELAQEKFLDGVDAESTSDVERKGFDDAEIV